MSFRKEREPVLFGPSAYFGPSIAGVLMGVKRLISAENASVLQRLPRWLFLVCEIRFQGPLCLPCEVSCRNKVY